MMKRFISILLLCLCIVSFVSAANNTTNTTGNITNITTNTTINVTPIITENTTINVTPTITSNITKNITQSATYTHILPTPEEFYGNVTYSDGSPLPIGSQINAMDQHGKIIGTFNMTESGRYGDQYKSSPRLLVHAEYTDDEISFYVGTIKSSTPSRKFDSAAIKRLDIISHQVQNQHQPRHQLRNQLQLLQLRNQLQSQPQLLLQYQLQSQQKFQLRHQPQPHS